MSFNGDIMIDWNHHNVDTAFEDWESFAKSGPDGIGVSVECEFQSVPPDLPARLNDVYVALTALIPDGGASKPFNGSGYYLKAALSDLRHSATEQPGCKLVFGPSDYRTFIATNGMEEFWARQVLVPGEWTSRQDWIRKWTGERSKGEVSPFFCNSFGINILITIPNPNGPGTIGLFVQRPIRSGGSGNMAVSAGLTIGTVDEGLRPGPGFDQISERDMAPDLSRAVRRGLEEEFGFRRNWPLNPAPRLLDVGLVRSVHQAAALYHLHLQMSWDEVENLLPHAQDGELEIGSIHRVPMTHDAFQSFCLQQWKSGFPVCSWIAVLALRVLGPQLPKSVPPTSRPFRYDFVISYAGEDIDTASKISKGLIAAGFNVFFDKKEQSRLLGRGFIAESSNIYAREGRYCIMIISQSYVMKKWPSHEFRIAMTRAIAERDRFIIPYRLDDAWPDGLPTDTGYATPKSMTISVFVKTLVKIFEEDNIAPSV
ncbi:MAG: toll/interleukin-1 receptor domain-containing protein [Ardenticatenia bacterium]|nr:toll/interleukin-1 receptor domain-containing protein [Ardenticatenia bacterium]